MREKSSSIGKRKILMLGGSAQQIVAIEKAKELGYYTVLCDFLPDNPGQHVADRFYLASTTDKERILEIGKAEGISGILAYASDPAAPTAAYVAEKLGLPGNPYRSVEILCNKDLFREYLSQNGFCTPAAKGFSDIGDAYKFMEEGFFRFPVIVKPVDSSGSKGVHRIDGFEGAKELLTDAMDRSRGHRIIVEEYVEKYGYQIAGDGLSIDGKLVFRLFGNDHFNSKCENPFVPVSASFPYIMPRRVHDKIHAEIQRLLTSLGMKDSTYNFDLRIDEHENVYLMEVAPRDGGNYIPQVIEHLTGVNLVEMSVRVAMGEKIDVDPNPVKGYSAYFAVHSMKTGILEEVVVREDCRKKIWENHIVVKPGDEVHTFIGSNNTLGCLLMEFDSEEEMLDMMDHPEKWIEVRVKE